MSPVILVTNGKMPSRVTSHFSNQSGKLCNGPLKVLAHFWLDRAPGLEFVCDQPRLFATPRLGLRLRRVSNCLEFACSHSTTSCLSVRGRSDQLDVGNIREWLTPPPPRTRFCIGPWVWLGVLGTGPTCRCRRSHGSRMASTCSSMAAARSSLCPCTNDSSANFAMVSASAPS
jgi:hypothetical protein